MSRVSDVTIERADNGFIWRSGDQLQTYATLEAVFDRMLMYYEGRSTAFQGGAYGRVVVLANQEVEQFYQKYGKYAAMDDGLAALLVRLYDWDVMSTGDGPYWKREIEKAMNEAHRPLVGGSKV